MSCHNAPYTTKEKNASRIVRKGEYIWRDYLGFVVYRYMSIGDKSHLLTPLDNPSCKLISPNCKYWIKWIDPSRADMFVVPSHDFKCFGFVISWHEFYFSFVCPFLV